MSIRFRTIWTVTQAAVAINMPRRTLDRAIWRGDVPVLDRKGDRWLLKDDVLAFAAARAGQKRPIQRATETQAGESAV